MKQRSGKEPGCAVIFFLLAPHKFLIYRTTADVYHYVKASILRRTPTIGNNDGVAFL